MINILHISRTMGQGGAEKVVYQICKEKNKDTNMYIASTGGFLADKLKEQGITHVEIPDIDKKNPLLMIKTYFILRKIIKKHNISIIHSHHRMAAFYSKLIFPFSKKIKKIYTAHNVFTNRKRLTAFSLKGSMIVAVGDGVKKNLIEFFGVKESNIKIIYNSIEAPNKLNKLNDKFATEKKDKIYIGTIGRLNEQKGIDIFIKSIAPLIKSNNKIYGIVVGAGELEDDLKRLSKDIDIEKNIIFLGYRKDVFEIINVLDFVVLSSRWEGFPLTPIETFSMKKTIIATNIAGNNEIVKNNINGLLFEKDNIEELTEKMEYLINNPSELKKLEEESFKDYKEKYSYKTFIDKYMKIYK